MLDRLAHIDQIEAAARITRVLLLLEAGKTDAEIMDETGYTAEVYDATKAAAMKQMADFQEGREKKEIYAEYLIRQNANITDLTSVIRKLQGEGAKSYSQILVSAIRARSDIYDRMVKTGQDLGFIEKILDEKRVTVAVLLAKLNDDQLLSHVYGQLAQLDDLMKTVGSGEILDVAPGQIHRALPAPKESKTNRAQANKVHKGRRVVKGKG